MSLEGYEPFDDLDLGGGFTAVDVYTLPDALCQAAQALAVQYLLDGGDTSIDNWPDSPFYAVFSGAAPWTEEQLEGVQFYLE